MERAGPNPVGHRGAHPLGHRGLPELQHRGYWSGLARIRLGILDRAKRATAVTRAPTQGSLERADPNSVGHLLRAIGATNFSAILRDTRTAGSDLRAATFTCGCRDI
jgi:hypothetical protein